MVGRSFAVIDLLFFLIGTGRIDLQPFQPIARFFPPAAQDDHLLVQHRHAVMADPDALIGGCGADPGKEYPGLAKYLLHLTYRLFPAFEHQAEFLGKKGRENRRTAGKGNIEAAVAGKGHLQQGGDQSTVTAVVTGRNQAFVYQLLDRGKARFQLRSVGKIGTDITHLAHDLG
ncbi:MAG: hypothetical protein ACD_75C00216G0001 [uncultured bacterium]|nr:MAG: hypothetical protein ACD_75C00216G0001 [uncultured bacterium]